MPKALALIAHNLEGIYSVVFDKNPLLGTDKSNPSHISTNTLHPHHLHTCLCCERISFTALCVRSDRTSPRNVRPGDTESLIAGTYKEIHHFLTLDIYTFNANLTLLDVSDNSRDPAL